MIGYLKEVYYNEYCSKCRNNTKVDKDGFPVEKCEECQATPMNTDSNKPVNWEAV